MSLKRQIALDTETTGKDADGGPGDHKIIEIGCVEIIDRKITGREFHVLLNPEREVDPEAAAIHGMTWDMLKNEPKFRDIVEPFIDFIRGSELLIHNAKFDVGFINHELNLINSPEHLEDIASVTDTIALARKLHPSHQVKLDNLCKVFGIDNSNRTLHGALLDAQLLAEVYIAMTSNQTGLMSEETANGFAVNSSWQRPSGMVFPMLKLEPERRVVHINTTIDLAQGHKMFTEGEQDFAGSDWGNEYTVPYLAKGKEESKGDYKKRIKSQKEEMINHLLNKQEQELLQKMLEIDKEAYQEWEDRVMGRKPPLPDPY